MNAEVTDPQNSESFPNQIRALWAPWRVEYFRQKEAPKDFLLEAAQSSDDRQHLVITRRKNTFLIANRYPYSSGHLMVVPNRKVATLDALSSMEQLELFELAIHAQTLLKAAIGAQGFNLGLNLGECAGAGVADHLHLHIVPRWQGDRNFMPVLANTQIFPEALEHLYDKLLEVQEELAKR